MQFPLDELQQHLDYLADRFGTDFVYRIAVILNESDDLKLIERQIGDLFSTRGTTYYEAISESELRFSSPTGTHRVKKSPNYPKHNEMDQISKRIEELKRQEDNDRKADSK